MNKVKKGLDNQAVGLLPLLLFMFLDNYFSYLLSFIIGVTFCFVCIFLYQVLSKDKVYQFLLLLVYRVGMYMDFLIPTNCLLSFLLLVCLNPFQPLLLLYMQLLL